MKVIIESLATIAKRKAGECKVIGCNGEGILFSSRGGTNPPCPNCASLREFQAEMEHRAKCIDVYPTPDIPTLRSYMEILGVWEKFVNHVLEILIDAVTYAGCSEPTLNVDTPDFSWADAALMLADILTSDKFYGAVAEFLDKEVEE